MITFKKQVCEIIPTYNKRDVVPSCKVTCAFDAVTFLKSIWPVDLSHREAMVCLNLNRANNVIGWSVISTGGISGTVCDPKILFQNALIANASSLIISHNHPSSNIKPSHADIQLTNKIKAAGNFLDLPLLDHIILTEDSHFSFADEGMI